MPDIASDDKALAHYLRKVFGGTPQVHTHWDENESRSVAVLSARNRPVDGITSFVTIGLSGVPIGLDDGDKPLRIELVLALPSIDLDGGNLLASAAFQASQNAASMRPGAVLAGILALYDPARTMQHVLLTSPSPGIWRPSGLIAD
jgi:hypothetical protein